jgi:hypothetical protein
LKPVLSLLGNPKGGARSYPRSPRVPAVAQAGPLTSIVDDISITFPSPTHRQASVHWRNQGQWPVRRGVGEPDLVAGDQARFRVETHKKSASGSYEKLPRSPQILRRRWIILVFVVALPSLTSGRLREVIDLVVQPSLFTGVAIAAAGEDGRRRSDLGNPAEPRAPIVPQLFRGMPGGN